jgi:hypothetical protein
MKALDQHVCTDAGCSYVGQRTDRDCKCHVRTDDFVRAQRDALLSALVALTGEETVPVHIGYDSGQNYIWGNAVLTDSDAFREARAAIRKATGGAS